jgi:hypothetical protein
MFRILGIALLALTVACGAAPSLTLVGPKGPIAGLRLSDTERSWFGTSHGDAFPTAAPSAVRVSGAGGANLHVETNMPTAQMLVRIEQGTFESRKLLDAGSRQLGAAIHLDVSPDPYFVTITLESGSGSTTALFVVKVDGTP